MKKWNVAIIGLGFVGKLHYDALRRLPNVHVRTIVVHKAQDIPLVKENYDADVVTDCWQEAVADPQIQVIHNCTPNALHDEINLAVIRAGKHLYAEKPMSLTTAGAEEVLAAAKAAGIAHAINYQCRMNGAVLEMRARLQRGQAGRPLYVGGQYLQESVARKTDYTPRRIPETSPARALLDIGVHWADTAGFVMGCPISRVYAKMYTHHPIRIDPETGREIVVRSDDTTSVMVEFADGTPGSVTTSDGTVVNLGSVTYNDRTSSNSQYAAISDDEGDDGLFSKCMLGHKNDLRVSVSGDEKEFAWHMEQCDRLWVGQRERGNESVYVDRNTALPEVHPYIHLPAGHTPGWMDALTNAMQAFYDSLNGEAYAREKVPYATFEDGVMGTRFVDACLDSARQERRISL